jgi:tripartite-type tricarboxylate transporter receptor subunit TctC
MNKFALSLVATLALVAASTGWAQTAYPSKPVKLVLGFTPGSAADVVARIFAPKLSESLGQQLVVENKPGAGSNIAAESVVKAQADGYTLFLGSVANTINASLSKGLSFDFGKDLAPVAGIATLPNLLVVHPSLQARTVQELVSAAKAKPEGVMFGSSGNGTSPHLSGELFNLMAGVKLVHVPYKGSPQAVTDLLAGRVQVMFSPASTVLQHIKAGTLKGLASTGLERASATPELPTIAESGMPGFETSVWFGLLAPAATPRDIVERLHRETARVLAGADVKAQFAVQGIDTMSATPEQFGAYIRQETAKWARVVQASGARVD